MTTVAHAGHLLERARWAARAYADYDQNAVSAIATAVADAGYAAAERFAEAAVTETEMGVAAHKLIKNRAVPRGILEQYRGEDLISPRIDSVRKIVEIPRPAGVVLAITPATNPVSAVYFKVILALLTRNAVVVAPHPRARHCSADAARVLAEAAVNAGAPDGIVQVIDEPSVPLVEELMADERTDLIVATGDTAVVRAAHSSGNPALGVAPGNVPVLVDASADINAAARRIVDSKAFDNSLLCANESVLIAEESIAEPLRTAFTRNGAHVLDPDDAQRLREFMFPFGHLNTDVVGREAAWIAGRAGLQVGPKTRVLIVPFEHVVDEEVLTHEKLSPVLGMTTVADAERGIRAARAVVRIGGVGHSAAIHSEKPSLIMDFAARLPVPRVLVNVGSSTGSSLGYNLRPHNLMNWTRIAYNSDSDVGMPNFAGITPWRSPAGPVPEYPRASNERDSTAVLAGSEGRNR